MTEARVSFGDDVHDREQRPPSVDPLEGWPTFSELVRRRLEAGRSAYADRSFWSDPSELLGELQQEALDLAGWGFVLFARLERMQRELTADRDRAARGDESERLVGAARGRAGDEP
jgi:hypothetical protein